MLALFGNLSPLELLLIALAAIMIFGRNLPQIAVKAAVQFSKARRNLNKVWRETGVQDEFRRMQREMRAAEYEVRDATRRAVDAEIAAEEEEADESEGGFEGAEHDAPYQEESEQEDSGETSDEPAGEAERRAEPHPGPDPYPGDTD